MIIDTSVYNKATDSFGGNISTSHFQFSPVEIKPIAKNGENGSDYRLTYDTANSRVELGTAWKKNSE